MVTFRKYRFHQPATIESISAILTPMSASLLITPGGQLHLQDDPDGSVKVPPEHVEALRQAFASSSAEGLLLLASRELAEPLPATLKNSARAKPARGKAR